MKRLEIKGGVLTNTPYGVLYEPSEGGGRILFDGARFVVGFALPDTAWQFSGRIMISRSWLRSGFTVRHFAHEYGHYLQQRDIGLLRYTAEALKSAFSLITNPRRHYARAFEEDATKRGESFAGVG